MVNETRAGRAQPVVRVRKRHGAGRETVIADAQKALGDPTSITYSGSAKDVSFQQCGANATQTACQGTHNPMRPIASYVRVIDLARADLASNGHDEQHRARWLDDHHAGRRSSSRSRRNRRIFRSRGRSRSSSTSRRGVS